MEQPPIPLLAENEVQRYYPQAPSSGNNPSLFGLDMIDYLNEDQRNAPQAPSSGENPSLFDPVMKGDWDKVLELYGKHQSARIEKLTKSEQTALHIAISCNHQESKHRKFHLKKRIDELLNAIPDDWSYIVLGSKDIDGNTPLHLAAALGNDQLCKQILTKCPEVSDIKNNDHATPLYMAVHHGKQKSYRCLRACDEKRTKEAEQEVWLGKDGNTILHSAIKGEYFSEYLSTINHPFRPAYY